MFFVQILFFLFAGLAILGSLFVITSKNPIRAVLSKVLTFVAGAGIWMTLQAEYLSLLLIVIYVGAVLVMFLFVVMMIDVKMEIKKASFFKYWPVVILVILTFLSLMSFVFIYHGYMGDVYVNMSIDPANQRDIADLGMSLYSYYLYPFELVGLILLSAMISAFALNYRGKKKNEKYSKPSEQVKVNPKDRIRLISMKSSPIETKT